MSAPQAPARVTVAGTGTMGSALVRALLAAGYPVTVWNRTPARAEVLGKAGAAVAETLASAVEASDVTLMCVADQAAAGDLVAGEDVRSALRGRTLVQLTTGTPADGRRNAEAARAAGIAYLDGAIMAYPRTIGSDAAAILYAGPRATFERERAMFARLGQARYAGEDAGRAAVLDAALIAFFYGTLAGFVHGGALTAAEGIGVEEYLDLAGPFWATFISGAVQETAERIREHRYGDAQSSMHTHLGGIDLLVVGSSREAGIDHDVMTAIRDMFARAVAAGRGDDDIACLLEVAIAGR